MCKLTLKHQLNVNYIWKSQKGYSIQGHKETEEYALKLHGNTYGQKQAGRVWYQHLTKGLIKELGFTQSKIDPCVFYKGKWIYVLYTDDSILTGPNKTELAIIVQQINQTKLNITIQGEIQDFLGVTIDRLKDGRIKFSQPLLIQKIINTLGLKDNTKTKRIPMASSKRLLRHKKSTPFDNSFNYRSIIGLLNYFLMLVHTVTSPKPHISVIDFLQNQNKNMAQLSDG